MTAWNVNDTQTNVHAYATAKVNNKGWKARVKHSAKLHDMRSALSFGAKPGAVGIKGVSIGSFASKVGGVAAAAGRTALAFIPIPVLGSLASTLVSVGEEVIRAKLHDRRLASATDNAVKVKFELKDLSVENLDRYRWKLERAAEEVRGAVAAYNAAGPDGKTCDGLSKLAIAIAQVERRHKILTDQLAALQVVIDRAATWANGVKGAVDANKTALNNDWKNMIEAEASDSAAANRHQACGEFCYYSSVTTLAGDPGKHKQNLIAFAKTVTQPLNFANVLGSVSFKADDYSADK